MNWATPCAAEFHRKLAYQSLLEWRSCYVIIKYNKIHTIGLNSSFFWGGLCFHACHLLFQLAVDGQHLGMADKGKGQNGDSVGGLEEWLKKLPTIVIAIPIHIFKIRNNMQMTRVAEGTLQPLSTLLS